MKVKELIQQLRLMPPDADVVTNQCEATHAHEEIIELDEDRIEKENVVYVGS